MPKATVLEDEAGRIAALKSYRVLDTHAEQPYDDITRLASSITGCPIALVALIDKDRQWFKSRVGIEIDETKRELAFCAQAIKTPSKLMVVEDASKDPQFKDNPLVTKAPHIRFYAGQPLVDSDGFALGTLCVIDTKPNTLSAEHKDAMAMLARMVITLLEARRNNAILKIQNTYLEMAEQSADLGHWSINFATDEIIWSNEVYRIHGVAPEEYTPELPSAIDFYHPDDRAIVEKHVKKAIEQKTSFAFDLRLIRPSGEIRYVSSKGETQLSEAGELENLFGTFQDITERVLAEQELKLNQERLNLAILGGEIGFWDWNVKTGVTNYSEHWAGMLGYVTSELKQDFSTWEKLCHKEDITYAQKMLEAYFSGQTDKYEIELRMKHKDGSTRWILSKGSIAEHDEEGKPSRVAGIHIDITQRKQNENQIEESRAFLQTIMDANPDLMFVKDSKFRIIQANPAFLNLYPEDMRDSIIGTTTIESYNAEEADAFLEQDKIAFAQGKSEVMETLAFPDGKNRTLYTQKVRFKNPFGEEYILCIARDVTELKTLQARLASMGRILENSLDEVFIFNTDDLRYVYLNRGAQKNVGFGIEDYCHMTPLDISTRYSEEDYHETIQPLLEGTKNTVTIQTEHIRKDATTYEAEIHMQLDEYDGKQVIVAIALDVTDRVKAERQREALIDRLSDSNEELERFAYICSHDLQEPLRMIRSFSERLESHLSDMIKGDEKAEKYFHFMSDGAKRAQNLISDILLYSSLDKDTRQNETVNLNEIIKVVRDNLEIPVTQMHAQILSDDLPTIRGNKTQLYQLFLNLISNGLKYQNDGAQPIVHIGVMELDDMWEFSIKDNGIGIEKQHLHKIFDVFQRLHRKEQYQGTGVGLSICKKVVDRHNGIIWVESSPDKGSIFHFRIPKELALEKAA